MADLLAQMRAKHDDQNHRLGGVSEEQMGRLGAWGQRQMPIRSMYYQLLIHEKEHTIQVVKTLQALGLAQDEARLILGQLQEARGALEGLLIGLSDEDLDRAPEGEWSIRQVIQHMMGTEDSYGGRLGQAISEALSATDG
jgi:hypothetical protein